MMSIKIVPRTMKNRREFRTLARDNCGESMEPGENEIMYFGYPASDEKQKGLPIACASLLPCNTKCNDYQQRDYYHWITYIFVHERFKGEGFGTQLLRHVQYDAWLNSKHPIRADVAHKAVPFFEKNGYFVFGDVWSPAAGNRYFRRLHPMQLDFRIVEKEELWDS